MATSWHETPSLFVLAFDNCCDYCNDDSCINTAVDPSKKVKKFPHSLPSIGPGADPGVQAVSPQVTISHPPGGRLPLLSTKFAVTFPAAEHHRPLTGTKLYCLVTEAHTCEQLAQGCYAALPRVGFEHKTCWSLVQCSTRCTTVPFMCQFLVFAFDFVENKHSLCSVKMCLTTYFKTAPMYSM